MLPSVRCLSSNKHLCSGCLSDYADFKAIYLAPSKLEKRHPVNIEDSVWEKLERIARILGDRDTTVGSYINAVLLEHLNLYADDIEIWRKL